MKIEAKNIYKIAFVIILTLYFLAIVYNAFGWKPPNIIIMFAVCIEFFLLTETKRNSMSSRHKLKIFLMAVLMTVAAFSFLIIDAKFHLVPWTDIYKTIQFWR